MGGHRQFGGGLGQFGQDRREVDHADLVRARLGHDEGFAGLIPGGAPRIGRAAVDVVEEDGVDHGQGIQADDGFWHWC